MALVPIFLLGTVLYFVAAYFFFFRRFSPSAKVTFLISSVITMILVLLSLWSESAPTVFWQYQLDLGSEKNPGATFNSALIILAALVTLYNMIAIGPAALLTRVYWLILTVFFLIMAADEYFLLHERHVGGFDWDPVYTVLGIILALGTLAMLWHARTDRHQLWLFFAILTGIALVGMGGNIIDEFIDRGALNFLGDHQLRNLHAVEDFFEMAGFTLILTAALTLATTYSPPQTWRKAAPIIAAAALGWTVFIILWYWVLPTVELNNNATPVHVSFLAGDLELLGYRLYDEAPDPGDSLDLTLYWRANAPLERSYGMAAHLLTKPDATSIAQQSYLPDLPQTHQWPVGVILRHTINDIPVPPDLSGPQGLWVMVSAFRWRGSSQTEFEMEPITFSDQPLLSTDSVLLTSLPVVPAHELPTPSASTKVTFANDLQLTGVDLPAALTGETATLAYWWTTGEALSQDLTQFLHIFHSNEEDVYVFDRQPFDGRFPTQDWPGGISVMDEQTIPLPGDIPAGNCAIYTGWYDAITQERLPAVDEAGQPVANHIVYLGEIPCGKD